MHETRIGTKCDGVEDKNEVIVSRELSQLNTA